MEEQKLFGKSVAEWVECGAVHTAAEIAQQPATWEKTCLQIHGDEKELESFVAQVTDESDFDVVLTGAGTSEYIGNTVFPYLNEHMGFHVHSFATTDIVEAPRRYLSPDKPTLLVSYGRSGDSPESVGAIQAADVVCGNVRHLFITCNRDGALSKLANGRDDAYAVNLTPETLDQSFAMTSSYTNMALATMLAFAPGAPEADREVIQEIARATRRTIDRDWRALKKLVAELDFKKIVYLGANCLKGVAQESQLKMLELTQGAVTTMFDSPMGFRHGPKSVVDKETLVVVYLSDDPHARCYERDLVLEISGQRSGDRLVVVGNGVSEEYGELADYCFDVQLVGAYDNAFLGLAYIPYAQILALFKSLSVGIHPDDPCPTGEVNRVVQGVTIYPVE